VPSKLGFSGMISLKDRIYPGIAAKRENPNNSRTLH
jgi:hypothetical protein